VFAGAVGVVVEGDDGLDDAATAKLMRTSRSDSDPLARLIVELLARTGIRKGELLALTVDAGTSTPPARPVVHSTRALPGESATPPSRASLTSQRGPLTYLILDAKFRHPSEEYCLWTS